MTALHNIHASLRKKKITSWINLGTMSLRRGQMYVSTLLLCTFLSLVHLRESKVFPLPKHHSLKVNRKFEIQLNADVTSALMNVTLSFTLQPLDLCERDTGGYRTKKPHCWCVCDSMRKSCHYCELEVNFASCSQSGLVVTPHSSR